MATITARVTGTGGGELPGQVAMIVSYQMSEPVGGAHVGEISINVDQQITDQEIESSIRSQLAAYITGIAGQTFTEADVRGCRF